MILVCPSCDTRYFAEDNAIGKEGRRVRCASCGHSWFAKPQDEDAPAAAVDTGLTREQVERLRQTAAANSAARAGPHAEFRAREHARRQRARSGAAFIAWLLGFVIFAGAAGAAVFFRNDVADAWPRAASLYRMVGLDVNRFGLLLENVGAKRSFDGTTPVLTVTGSAVNQSKERRAVPELRVSLRDENGKEIQSWKDSLSAEFLDPGQRVEFTSRFEAPPVETYRLSVTFAPKPGEAPSEGGATVESGDITSGEGAPAEGGHEASPSALLEPDAHKPAPATYEEPSWNGGDGGSGEAEPAAASGHAPEAAPASGGADHH
jgi:predicted Zn finger-like uncharacterized protein